MKEFDDESVCRRSDGGAIGKQLVPRLVAAGHEVHGMTRSESKQAMLHELGELLLTREGVRMVGLYEAQRA